jgi:THO complex subunit 3
VGSADALVSLWDVEDLACLRTFGRLQFPIRTVSFTHDSKMIASASEDLCIDVVRYISSERLPSLPSLTTES